MTAPRAQSRPARPTSPEQRELTALPQCPDEAIPLRSSSLPKKSRPQTGGAPKPRRYFPRSWNDVAEEPTTPTEALPARPRTFPSESATQSDPPAASTAAPAWTAMSAVKQRPPRHQPLAPNDPFPLNPLYYIPAPDAAAPGGRSPAGTGTSATSPPRPSRGPSDPRIPRRLVPNTTPATMSHAAAAADATILPDLVQDVVKEHAVEIVREDVSNEVHVHHYYTHAQSAKVDVDLLAARHFLVDERTGQKVEIPAPDGWVMPESMRPPPQSDLSAAGPDLAPTTHPSALVDDSSPPATTSPKRPTKQSSREWRDLARASHGAKWSPFPKVP